MWISYFMIPTYMLQCVLIGTKPCKYFQLNSEIFNGDKGIFSKMEIDQLVPEKWRLAQYYDDGVKLPGRYPVFVKPEFQGQVPQFFGIIFPYRRYGEHQMAILNTCRIIDTDNQCVAVYNAMGMIELVAPGKN